MFMSSIKYFIYCEIQYMTIKHFYKKICYDIDHFFLKKEICTIIFTNAKMLIYLYVYVCILKKKIPQIYTYYSY